MKDERSLTRAEQDALEWQGKYAVPMLICNILAVLFSVIAVSTGKTTLPSDLVGRELLAFDLSCVGLLLVGVGSHEIEKRYDHRSIMLATWGRYIQLASLALVLMFVAIA